MPFPNCSGPDPREDGDHGHEAPTEADAPHLRRLIIGSTVKEHPREPQIALSGNFDASLIYRRACFRVGLNVAVVIVLAGIFLGVTYVEPGRYRVRLRQGRPSRETEVQVGPALRLGSSTGPNLRERGVRGRGAPVQAAHKTGWQLR